MSETELLQPYLWPATRLGELVAALGQRSGFIAEQVSSIHPPAQVQTLGDEAMDEWMYTAATYYRVEAEPIATSYITVTDVVRHASPTIIRLILGQTHFFLGVISNGRRQVTVLGPDGTVARVPIAAIVTLLRAPIEHTSAADINHTLNQAQIATKRRTAVRAALLRERLGPRPIRVGWMLRSSPGSSFWRQITQTGIVWRFVLFMLTYTGSMVILLLSWWLLGWAILRAQIDPGWLMAWALTLASFIPIRLCSTWLQGWLVINIGVLLKPRLLLGTLQLEPEHVRHQGAGQFLGRVIESEMLESSALSGGFPALKGLIELTLAISVLSFGAGGVTHSSLLAGWAIVTLLLLWRFYRQRQNWTAQRLTMTHDLIERMVGHRTLLAQQPPALWHSNDDQSLTHYLASSRPLDRTSAWLIALVPRAWVVISLVVLAPAFISGAAPELLAIGVGGTLLAMNAFNRITIGSSHVAGALIAWQRVQQLFHVAAHTTVRPDPTVALPTTKVEQPTTATSTTSEREEATLVNPTSVRQNGALSSAQQDASLLLQAHKLTFRYREHGTPTLQKCSLAIHMGDRLLLQGPSGGGKTTLAAMLAGLRMPGSGLLLLHGLDYQTIGVDGWRRRVAAAPQFHENHVLSETFAFNLLMGRRWPPTLTDLEEAEAVCHALGLGELLNKMPSGLLQQIGETGWQLSHGERSRLYLARALLQGADLIVLDESFAALDPETLTQALQCALDRAPTLMVIAHP